MGREELAGVTLAAPFHLTRGYERLFLSVRNLDVRVLVAYPSTAAAILRLAMQMSLIQ